MEKEVFVSYATENKDIADSIVGRLEAVGVSCWYAPRDIQPGQGHVKAIMDALNTCVVTVLILSNDSLASRYCQTETIYAFGKNKVIIPFKLTPQDPTGDFAFLLLKAQWIDAVNADGRDQAYHRLLEAVRIHTNAAEGAPAGASVADPPVNAAPKPCDWFRWSDDDDD